MISLKLHFQSVCQGAEHVAANREQMDLLLEEQREHGLPETSTMKPWHKPSVHIIVLFQACSIRVSLQAHYGRLSSFIESVLTFSLIC